MDLPQLLGGFILTDIVFSGTFCLGGFLEQKNNMFMFFFILLLAATYYPLAMYIKEAMSETVLKNQMWHFKYNNTCVYYCGSRVVYFTVYLMVAMTDMSATDVVHAFSHFPILTIVIILIMACSLAMLVALTLRINPIHNSYVDTLLNRISINATIIHNKDPIESIREHYTSFGHLKTPRAQLVVLVPKPSAQPNATAVTGMIKRADDYDYFEGTR